MDDVEVPGDAGRGCEPAVVLPPYRSLLGEFLVLMGRMEVDFVRRPDTALLADPTSAAHRQDPQHHWAPLV
ncbi:hypothetical protein [Actinacidiphila paucisporea]|uniref:hypothetical protein n=1 Tax=Actinacidiphila paucisporea TaxID=310782 RepID=UPI001160FF80|nr:hypothetical protein [Actinacidiphila paucisporea]